LKGEWPSLLVVNAASGSLTPFPQDRRLREGPSRDSHLCSPTTYKTIGKTLVTVVLRTQPKVKSRTGLNTLRPSQGTNRMAQLGVMVGLVSDSQWSLSREGGIPSSCIGTYDRNLRKCPRLVGWAGLPVNRGFGG